MTKHFTVAILISTYNWPEALAILFKSIIKQSVLPDEILIADDGSPTSTKRVVDSLRYNCCIPVKYAWQEDRGFRKSLIVNKIMKEATADYIIQVDGDIVLHQRFIEDHLKNAEQNKFVQGSRTVIKEKMTRDLLSGNYPRIHFFSQGISNRFNAIRLPLFSTFIKVKPDSSDNIKACNLAFWRKHYFQINGYNNEFMGWGWEDAEFAARLINAGIKQKRLKLAANCYHLHHKLNSKYHIAENEREYHYTIATKRIFCSNGFEQVVKNVPG